MIEKKIIKILETVVKKKINFNKEVKILDIGCGRGKIISSLSKKYRMNNFPLGIDVIKHKDTEKRIRFLKINALKYLRKTKEKLINC